VIAISRDAATGLVAVARIAVSRLWLTCKTAFCACAGWLTASTHATAANAATAGGLRRRAAPWKAGIA
jgi:hypothetical protein